MQRNQIEIPLMKQKYIALSSDSSRTFKLELRNNKNVIGMWGA